VGGVNGSIKVRIESNGFRCTKGKLIAVVCISKNKTLNKKVADSYLSHAAIFIQIPSLAHACGV
jgi:hypothetical protein